MNYIYLGRSKGDNKHEGVICVGYIINEDQILFTTSFCSPKDPFSRPKAHLILQGRLAKGNHETIVISADDEKARQYEEVREAIMNHMKQYGCGECIGGARVPHWAVPKMPGYVELPKIED